MAAITGNFSCDNSYSIWVGDATRVSTKLLEHTNTTAGQIFAGEDLPPFEPVPECHLYMIAWSDDGVYQGLIGSFTGAVSISTGDPRWRVLPARINKGNNQFPSQAEINSVIAAAAPQDWKTPFVGASNGGPPWNAMVTSVAPSAKWIWYDSGKDTRAKYPSPPYVPFSGFNHDEFLIFRIPCEEFNPAPTPNQTGGCNVTVNCGCNCSQEKPCGCKEKKPEPVAASECHGSCVFEVRLQRIRYLSGKPGGLFEGAAELSFVTHVDGNQFCYPTRSGTYVKFGKRKGDFWAGWYPINARAGVIEVKCGCTRQFDLMTEMEENPMKENGLPAVFEGGRPWGASEPAVVTIRCGEKPGPVVQTVQLELGGNRTENMAMEAEYRFSQISACGCQCGAKSA